MVHCKLSSKLVHYAQKGRNARPRGVRGAQLAEMKASSKWRGNIRKKGEQMVKLEINSKN